LKIVAWMAYHLETREIVDEYIARIRGLVVGHDLVVCEDDASARWEMADADIFVGWRITPEVFGEARRLRWIQFGSAGIDHTLFPELLASDVILTTMVGIHTSCVAEHVFALMLALSRRLEVAFGLQSDRRFDRSDLASSSDELAGKTIGIVGLGRIGQAIARIAMAFGMGVVGTKRTPAPELMVDEVFVPEDLPSMLPKCDYLVLVVPLTNDTRALIGPDEIALMKDGACLINVARGAMVDHDALADALHSGKLRGAALDVFPREPLPPESPIWDMPNTIITPHTAGSNPDYAKRAFNIFATNFNAFTAGSEMVNVYDRKRGY